MTHLFSFEWIFRAFIAVVSITGVPVQGQQQVVIDSYPSVTSVEQGGSIVLVCRVVGILPTATPVYSWTCKGDTCTGSEVVSNNRLSIGVINNNHQGDFTCTMSGSGVTTQSGTFTLDVTDGLALSAQGPPSLIDRFIPRNSFIEDSSAIASDGSTVVACRSDNSDPMWYHNGTAVTTTTTFNVYQKVRSSARSDLMIDNTTLVNSDYTCTSSLPRTATLGLYLTSGGGTLNPPTNLMSSSVRATSLVVSWTASTSSVTGYYISWRRTNHGGIAVGEYAQTTGVTYTITNLFAYIPYEITVWSTDGTRVSSPATLQERTTETAPSVPRLLRVVDTTSCQLDWLPPAFPNGAVTYTVQYQTSSGGSFMDVSTGLTGTHHTAVNLPSGTNVTLRVRAVNSDGMNDSNTAELQVPVLPQPVSPTASLTSSNTITVSWIAPTVSCPSIDDYIVVYNDGTRNRTDTSTGSPAALSNLQYATTYSLFVAARSNGVAGLSAATSPATITTLLPSPSNFMATSTSTSISLSWSPPPQGTVQSYKLVITGEGGPATLSNQTTTHMFSSLTPFTQYMVTIAAVDTMGREGDSSTIMVTTNLASPANFMVTTTMSTSITLSWTPAAQGTVQSYKLTITGGGSSQLATVTPPNATHMFTGLASFTQYSVTIVAVDSMDREGEINTITVTTNIAAPDNFRGTKNSTSIALSWSPPAQGTVQSYKLTFTVGGNSQVFNVSSTITTHVFSGLTPFTQYMVTIAAVDSMGRQGDLSTPITVTTDKSAPSPPRSLKVVTSSGTSVTLRWTAPAMFGDSSVDYIIGYDELDAAFTTSSTMFEVTGLASNTVFTFSLRARNSVGPSEAVTVQGSTTDVPQPVSSVSTPQPENSTSVSLSWIQASNPSNGTVQGYLLTIVIVGAAGNSTNGSVNVNGQSTTTTTLTALVPGTPYFVEVQVRESMRGLGLPRQTGVFFSQETDADTSAQVSGLTLSMDNTQLTWKPIPLIQAHHFFNYTITYTPIGSGTQKRQTPMMQTLSYSACTTTSCSLTLLELIVDVNYTVTVTITRSTNPGVTVPVLVREVATSPPPPPTSPMDTAVVAIAVGIAGAVVVAILIAVFIVCIVCLVRSKKSDYAVGREKAPYIVSNGGKEGCDSSENLLQLSNLANEEEREAKVQEHTRIILLEDFPSYVKDMHKDRDAGFEEEYKLLKTSLVAHAECAQKHTHKNRYGNIFAYDHSRVVLQSPDDDGVDYINASYIEGYHNKNCYIATQGPVPSSVDDFWQMVWEQRSPVIVMLTKIEEAGRKKCELYWPEKTGEPLVTDRNVKVTLVGLQHYADFEIRDFHITKEKSDKPLLEVKHFLYTVWPDHGVPQYATSVIKFIRRVRKSYPMSKDNKPIVIHCSAGVGRTGTYICLDVMLQRMNAESNFNVFEFVTAMRSNRTFMVQTMDQYIFIHDAIDELIVCGDTSIPSSNMRIKVNKMHKQLPGKDATVFEHQFELLQSVSHTPQSAEISEALSESNKPKNRYQEYIPYNLSRPRLLSMGIHNGADYINASYVDAYKESNYFVLTQSPLHTTIKEFWLTVWQVKSACLVMLCGEGKGKLDACVQFWPEKTGEETLYGKISVTLKSEEESEGFVTRKFEISEEGRNTPPNRVTLLHYCWPDEGCPTDHKPLLKIIGSVEKIQQATGNNPIVVMCQDGTGRSGAFAQIVSQIERMKVEGTVDYFQSIKLARLQRAHLVYSQDLYVFCHEFLLSYLDSFEGYSNFEFKRPTK